MFKILLNYSQISLKGFQVNLKKFGNAKKLEDSWNKNRESYVFRGVVAYKLKICLANDAQLAVQILKYFLGLNKNKCLIFLCAKNLFIQDFLFQVVIYDIEVAIN